MHPIGQQVRHRVLHEAEGVPGEILAERIEQAHLKVRDGDEGQQAQQDEDDRENGHEDLKRNRGCPDAQRALHHADNEEAEDIPRAHPFESPGVDALEWRHKKPPQRRLFHPRFPRLLAHDWRAAKAAALLRLMSRDAGLWVNQPSDTKSTPASP